MQEKVIATRNQFLEWNTILANAKPLSDTSVEYREALYIFMDKVERHIKKPASEIFALDEADKLGLQTYNEEIYKSGLKYAVKPPEIEGGDYEIASDNKEWIKVAAEIKLKYIDILDKQDKRKAELNEWSKKKIQLNIEKIELSKMPSLDSNTFYKVANIICTNLPEDEEEGKEVE